MFFGGFICLLVIIDSKLVKKGILFFLSFLMIAYSLSDAQSPTDKNVEGHDAVSLPVTAVQSHSLVAPLPAVSLPLLDLLPYGAFFSSSSHSNGHYAAFQSKMDNSNCWQPHELSNRNNQYVIVDLGALYTINQIDVGSQYWTWYDQHVTKYEIHYKVNFSYEWHVLSRHGANPDQQFVGPTYHKDIAINRNFKPFSARYVKFVPKEYYKEVTFRWELHGFLGQSVTTTVTPFDSSRAIGMN